MPNYTVKEIAEKLGISERGVRKIAEAHTVGKKFGRTWLFTARDLAWFQARDTTRGRKRKDGTRREAHDGNE